MSVTKKDLSIAVAHRTGMTAVDTTIIFEHLVDAIAHALISGRGIEIRGFGRFKIKAKKARTARNPRTGAVVTVPAGLKPKFEASRELRAKVDMGKHAVVF